MLELDHIAISGATLDDATEAVEAALGVSLQGGGQHDVFGTHNRLLGLADGLYLEAIAADPNATPPNRPRWFDLDRFAGSPRLTNWICRTPDLEAARSSLSEAGEVVDLQRGDLRWQMAVPLDGVLPFDNLHPALITWQGTLHPAQMLAPSGVRLRRLTVAHPQASDLSALLSPLLVDDRIAYEVGPAALTAEFDTPHGPRSIG